LIRSSKNCIKFAYSNRKNSSKILFGLVCQNVFSTDWQCDWMFLAQTDSVTECLWHRLTVWLNVFGTDWQCDWMFWAQTDNVTWMFLAQTDWGQKFIEFLISWFYFIHENWYTTNKHEFSHTVSLCQKHSVTRKLVHNE
jgi:hypothetical protein